MSRAQRRYGRKAYRRIRIHKWQSRHHLRCRSNKGGDDEMNISVLHKDHHMWWHNLFSNLLPPTICDILNQKFLDPRWKFICVEVQSEQKMEETTTGAV